jgi:hypothetical protein
MAATLSSVPDSAPTDLRLTRRLYVRPRWNLESVEEGFEARNRDKQRVPSTEDGFTSAATDFAQIDNTIGINHFPALYRKPANLARAPNCYPLRARSSSRSN